MYLSPPKKMITPLIFEISSLLVALPPPWRMMMLLEEALVLLLDKDPSQIMVMGRMIPPPSNFDESLYLRTEQLILKQL
jgi:hypothetical protein